MQQLMLSRSYHSDQWHPHGLLPEGADVMAHIARHVQERCELTNEVDIRSYYPDSYKGARDRWIAVIPNTIWKYRFVYWVVPITELPTLIPRQEQS